MPSRPPIRAVLDACVLYPAPLRDLLMQMTVEGLYQARWTEQIHEEWIRNVLKARPDLTEAQLLRTRTLMNTHALDSLVEGYETRIPQLVLPDLDDRHVLAAAIHSQAGVIVTFNEKDFPDEAMAPHGVVVEAPDAFLRNLIDLDAEAVLEAVRKIRARLRHPPQTVAEYLTTLERQGLVESVAWLRFGNSRL